MLELAEMSRAECERKLRARIVGRIAMTTPSGPLIIPINYAVTEDAVLVRTAPYSVLGAHGRGSVVALEIDEIDEAYHSGWSVVVRGQLDAVNENDTAEPFADRGPRPWAPGTRSLLLRLPLADAEVSGRVLGPRSESHVS